MARSDRLFRLLALLQDGALHRAADLARALDVSARTIYRDMEALVAAGLPVAGTRGTGYRLAELTTLPPLRLSPAELEALSLGIAIVQESADPDLAGAAAALAQKVDAALPAEALPPSENWLFAFAAGASAARGFSLMAPIRSAIRGRQKLRLTGQDSAGTPGSQTVRPLRLDHRGRAWVLTAWSETHGAFRLFRLDLVEAAAPLPELFVDEPGKTLADYRP